MTDDPGHPDDACPRCQAMATRIAELERRLEAQRGQPATTTEPEGEIRSGPPPAFPFELRAFRIDRNGWGAGWGLRPSPPRRAWMDREPYSYQCLPLVMANQWGWQVLCPTDVTVFWNGSQDRSGLVVGVDPIYMDVIKSQFGSGIVTFSPPWLFRTPPGWDLYAKAPSNRWKPNCVALDGVIETWWLNYTFTLNWKLVEPGTVTFARGESLGQLVPVPHGTFARSRALEDPLSSEPEIAADLMRWSKERQLRADKRVTTHHLYRKAEDIPDHLVRVPVPPLAPGAEVRSGKPGSSQPGPA